ncbi:MAG: chemotaxis-specific protein-glutamate methyltransferase CheB [Verrucomicrobiota bacterium]
MKIGIVNDMDMATQAIAATLRSSSEHQVVWTAKNGPEAIHLCRHNTPDLVLMDLVMPGMNGAQATREIMRSCPTGILVVTASIGGNCGLGFEAMGAGAIDIITTPVLVSRAGQCEFLHKIAQIEAIIASHQKPLAPLPATPAASASGVPQADAAVVVIGCSAGGPAALAQILPELDPGGLASVVIIQHIDSSFVEELARWLQAIGKVPVRLVAEGEVLEPGQIYLAGKDGHIEAHATSRLHYDANLRGLAYQPSVDVFLTSLARNWHGRALGIVLTGMGRDGAAGLRAMRDAGFYTIAQDAASSALFSMPKAAAPFAAEILPLAAIASRINRWIQTNH